MTPIQQLMLGAGSAKKKPYIDDVFSTYLWNGSGSNRSINNGIDLSGEGGLTWIKSRSNSEENWLFDTINGADWGLRTNNNHARYNSGSTYMSSFNNNGFSVGTHDGVNDAAMTYASWSFRKQKGFFDVVSYSGSGSAKTVAHSLGSVPGMIMIKRTDTTGHWIVYHRELSSNAVYLALNETWSEANTDYWNSTAPTATHFTIKDQDAVNANGGTYIAYLFAGGESTAAAARSIELTGANTDQYLAAPQALIPSGTDSNQFCLETWFNLDGGGNNIIYGQYNSAQAGRMFLWVDYTTLKLFVGGNDLIQSDGTTITYESWNHVAWSYDGTLHRLFLNGTLVGTYQGSSMTSINGDNPRIGAITAAGYHFNGKLSNFRVVHGQAVYTSSFKPSTVPLTTTSQGVSGTNCKVLCFNQSNELTNDGAFGNLTNPQSATITHHTTDSPFDDPAGFIFGENEDQNVIKCGSFQGAGSNYKEVYVGFEPQWILLKNADDLQDWILFDSMRGISSSDGDDAILEPNRSDTESQNGANAISITPTGFKPVNSSGRYTGSGHTMFYVAIRRPDGYVGKPAEAGTDVFNIAAADTTVPAFNTNFPVDLALYKDKSQNGDWISATRLTGTHYVKTNETGGESELALSWFAYNNGFSSSTGFSTNRIGWLWKRHAGLDVVAYDGNGTAGKQIRHNLNKVPEMIWTKKRNGTEDWAVYHKGLNGGTNPANWHLTLNNQDQEGESGIYWNNTIPTSTAFTVGGSNRVNNSGGKYISMLFASVDKISKVGYYTGNGTGQTITTGFQPRYLLIKRTEASQNWFVLDTLRGWGSGNDDYLELNDSDAQASYDFGAPTSTGFTLTASGDGYNANGEVYIYYAHA